MVAACSLPRGAALQSEVLNEQQSDAPSFQVVPVTRANMPSVATWPATGWHGHYHWPGTSSGPNAAVIRPGDMLDVTIWDSQDNSLLTNPGARFTEIEGVVVDVNGSIFLPYVERVTVSGLRPMEARSRIQARLEAIVPSAQVQVSMQQGRSHTVDVVGGVTSPGAYPMPTRNYKVLNLIADSGGIADTLRNPQLRLLRGHKTYEISAHELFANGSKNALLHPSDTLIVEEDERAFTALGASGQENLIYFPKDRISAMEALALMGGLADTRADPKGVLVLREYDASQLTPGSDGPNMQQVVFTFDLTSADGLFAARKFEIMPDDTVLATESPVTVANTLFSLIGSVFGIGTTVSSL